ncbi:MAG: hypothetical protein ABI036_18080 [Fibrobacteria bacterium]
MDAIPVAADSALAPETAAVLDLLRSRVASGLAGQESYDAFIDFLAENGAGSGTDDALGCRAWADAIAVEATGVEASGTEGEDIRWREIREAMAQVCPDNRSNMQGMQDGAVGGRATKRPHASLVMAQTVRPRQDPAAAGALPPPFLHAEGSLPGASARISLQGSRLETRFLRAGPTHFSVLAGHLHAALEETRLGFVAGGRFYAGWSGNSGLTGPLASAQSALDGLGLRARAGGWTLEAAGAWNRLRHGSHPDRNDAVLYTAGMARRFGGDGSALAFRSQGARQHFEPGSGPATDITVVGAALSNYGSQRNRFPRWSLGAAGSLADMPSSGAGRADAKAGNGLRAWGGYAEASLSSEGSASWKVQWRQADADWANPLQSPRGYLRDTLEGGWILPGRGEGGLSARMRFPLAAGNGYQADLRAGGSGDWGAKGLLSGESNLAVMQAWGEWIHETGATAAFLRPDPNRSPDPAGEAGRGGWGQSLAWQRRPWTLKAEFSWKGGEYSGSRPAPLGFSCSYAGAQAWSNAFTIGDIRNPWNYFRVDVHQEWKAGSKIRVEQTLRMPWTREGMTSDLGYQLRLAATP